MKNEQPHQIIILIIIKMNGLQQLDLSDKIIMSTFSFS